MKLNVGGGGGGKEEKNLPAFLIFCGEPQGPALFQKYLAHNYSFPVKHSSLLDIGPFFIFCWNHSCVSQD